VSSEEKWKIPFQGKILEKKFFFRFFCKSRENLKIFLGGFGEEFLDSRRFQTLPSQNFSHTSFIFLRGFSRKNLLVGDLSKRVELKA